MDFLDTTGSTTVILVVFFVLFGLFVGILGYFLWNKFFRRINDSSNRVRPLIRIIDILRNQQRTSAAENVREIYEFDNNHEDYIASPNSDINHVSNIPRRFSSISRTSLQTTRRSNESPLIAPSAPTLEDDSLRIQQTNQSVSDTFNQDFVYRRTTNFSSINQNNFGVNETNSNPNISQLIVPRKSMTFRTGGIQHPPMDITS